MPSRRVLRISITHACFWHRPYTMQTAVYCSSYNILITTNKLIPYAYTLERLRLPNILFHSQISTEGVIYEGSDTDLPKVFGCNGSRESNACLSKGAGRDGNPEKTPKRGLDRGMAAASAIRV